MPQFYFPDASRHARMFEFLRQSQQAALTAERLAAPATGQSDLQTLEDWCTKAILSLSKDPITSGT